MLHIPFKSHSRSRENRLDQAAQTAVRLGEREREVLEVLWTLGGATVQEMARNLEARLAYTTVMTVLDRLYKKGLLLREKCERAFLYRPAISQSELEQRRASAMVAGFFARSSLNRDALLSCLVDAVHSYDGDLLEQLEAKVKAAKARHPANEQTGKGGAQ